MDLLLFDVDGTLTKSGQNIEQNMIDIILTLSEKYDIGIVGGGIYDKILIQLGECKPKYIFAECGSVYYQYINNQYQLIHCNNIRDEVEYPRINEVVKLALKYLSNVNYLITGHMIDLRHGLIYISCIGMNATEEERTNFIELDIIHKYRENLYSLLQEELIYLHIEDTIEITYGGSVGVAIYPKKWNKVQILKYFQKGQSDQPDQSDQSDQSDQVDHYKQYHTISYFGDKYDVNGNDYLLLNLSDVIGYKVDCPNDTYKILEKMVKS